MAKKPTGKAVKATPTGKGKGTQQPPTKGGKGAMKGGKAAC